MSGWINIVLAIAGMYVLYKITVNIGFLKSGDYWRSLFQIFLTIWILGNFGWAVIDFGWAKNVEGAGNSLMARDISAALNPQTEIGGSGNCTSLLGFQIGACGESNITVQTPGSETVYVVPTPQIVQQPVVQQPQTFPKPGVVVFLLTARFPDGSEEDICQLDWTLSSDGMLWEPDVVTLCNERDQPSNETVSVSWSELVITSGALVPAISPQPAMTAPTPLPTVVEPTTIPQLTQEQWDKACGLQWNDWAAKNGLQDLKDANVGSVAFPAGTSWKLTGPGELASFWHSAGNEVWVVSSTQLGIANYPITGTLARGIPNAVDNGELLFTGAGTQCSTLGFPAP